MPDLALFAKDMAQAAFITALIFILAASFIAFRTWYRNHISTDGAPRLSARNEIKRLLSSYLSLGIAAFALFVAMYSVHYIISRLVICLVYALLFFLLFRKDRA